MTVVTPASSDSALSDPVRAPRQLAATGPCDYGSIASGPLGGRGLSGAHPSSPPSSRYGLLWKRQCSAVAIERDVHGMIVGADVQRERTRTRDSRMRGIALALVGLAISMFAGALYIASALKPSSPAEDAWAVPLFVVGVIVCAWGAVMTDLDRRSDRAEAAAHHSEGSEG